MPVRKLVWGIAVDKIYRGEWNVGICMAHCFEETYLFINLFKWSISIGRIYKDVRERGRT